jgi:uncharacterized protein
MSKRILLFLEASELTKHEFETSALRLSSRSTKVTRMVDLKFIFIGAVFALAGVAKGVIGLGLPTISMGFLAIVMPPVEAAAILIVPSLLTNAWQMLSGRPLAPTARRLWPMLAGVCVGTWAGIGMMTGGGARIGTALLGAALAIYGLFGLMAARFSLPIRWERLVGAFIGAVTGAIAAGTGVFVIPAVPYLQAIGLEKDDLVQALGLSFTVSTLALAVNIGIAGGLTWGLAMPSAWALATACMGMWIGQKVRTRLSPVAFRRWFFLGLLILGIYLAARATAS